MRTSVAVFALACLTACTIAGPSPLDGIAWRAIGPRLCGGRIEAIAVHDQTFYVGAGSGNLWRSEDQGTSWQPIFDYESTFAIGAVAVAPSNPDVLWVGTGEVLMARSSYAGTGVFRSTDRGRTWRNVGLADSYHIGRIVVHPTDPATAWVAAIGHNYTQNQQRGVFCTHDGGASWQHVLYVSPGVGAIDVVMHPNNPDQLFAVTWERDRKAWHNVNHGSGSAVHASTDGGKTWRVLAGGLPRGKLVGRIGLAISRSAPEIMYAVVDSNERDAKDQAIGGILFRSDDGGTTWQQSNRDPLPTRIGYDLCEVVVAPDNADELWVTGHYLLHSVDGGKTFERVAGAIDNVLPNPAEILHLDCHELWVDPDNGDHMLLGTDGGAYRTTDRGKRWLRLNDMPIAEVYALTLDDAVPYNIYIGTQDNAALFGPATGSVLAGSADSWSYVYQDPWGGGDSYFTCPDPSDANTIYYEHQFGELRRKDMRAATAVTIAPPDRDGEPPLRRNWMTPFVVSQHNPKTLLYGAQCLFRSVDRGDTWTAISPDLTSSPDASRQGNVPFGTITSISESPFTAEVLYVGTDDGLVQVTRDGGKTWRKLSAALPSKWVSRVVASQHDPARVYVTMTGYREDDFAPFACRSDDYGATWSAIVGGLPEGSINVVREDPANPDVLYLGSDRGIYVSFCGGAQWQSLRGNLPTTPVHDLAVQANARDLVIGTHGRGVFVLDLDSIASHVAASNR